MKRPGALDRRKTERSHRFGFMMIEVLIAMGLAGIILLGTGEMLIRAVQIGRSAAVRIALTEAACSHLERLKGQGRQSPELETGSHETTVGAGAGGEISIVWDVEAIGPRTLKIACTAALGSSERNRVSASVLVSERLGF